MPIYNIVQNKCQYLYCIIYLICLDAIFTEEIVIFYYFIIIDYIQDTSNAYMFIFDVIL